MTSFPQTQQRTFVAPDSRHRPRLDLPAGAQTAASTRNRARQAVGPSQEFGCVDWFLYPAAAPAESEAPVIGA